MVRDLSRTMPMASRRALELGERTFNLTTMSGSATPSHPNFRCPEEYYWLPAGPKSATVDVDFSCGRLSGEAAAIDGLAANFLSNLVGHPHFSKLWVVSLLHIAIKQCYETKGELG